MVANVKAFVNKNRRVNLEGVANKFSIGKALAHKILHEHEQVFGPTVFVVFFVSVLLMTGIYNKYEITSNTKNILTGHWNMQGAFRVNKTGINCTHFNITWYNIPFDIAYWHDAVYSGFNSCDYTNCQMWFGPEYVNYSDAVIFDGRFVRPEYFFKRKPGQIWIFSAHEAPVSFNDTGAHWTKGGWVSGYNWTMTYDNSNTDIHLPYGEIRRRPNSTLSKDYSKIFKTKKKSVLIVHSHCPTRSQRETYVRRLQRVIALDSYGNCGRPWSCGQRFQHDSGNCFDQINGYKFYLAFENAFCNQYFTEKLFRNYNYDSIMVIRGGRNHDANRMFPNGTFISTDDFKSIKELGDYLKKVGRSEKLYTEMLRRKDEYYSVPYKTVYQRAMCELCERMNNQDKYRKQIKNTIQWAFGIKQCEKPSDLNLF